MFWLRLLALCGNFTQAFEDSILERADRKAAEAIFTGVINNLSTFA